MDIIAKGTAIRDGSWKRGYGLTFRIDKYTSLKVGLRVKDSKRKEEKRMDRIGHGFKG